MQRSLMSSFAAVALAAVLCGSTAGLAAAQAKTPIDGRIVRVVYQVGSKGTWGFLLAHVRDDRYCFRIGNPGRLTLADFQQAAHICFDTVPATVDRSPELRMPAFMGSKPVILINSYKGAIAASGNDIILHIEDCTRVEGEAEEPCTPARYVVRMSGQECSAEITLFRRKAGTTTCEHYAAR